LDLVVCWWCKSSLRHSLIIQKSSYVSFYPILMDFFPNLKMRNLMTATGSRQEKPCDLRRLQNILIEH
jgi:hypothetical protein